MSKKCKECRQPFEPRFSTLEKYCWNSDCKLIEALQKLEQKKKSESKEWSERKSKLKKDMLTSKDYLQLAQQVFNKWIRKRDEGLNCISCGKVMKQGVIDAGHLWSAGGHANIRFNELNVNSQCSRPCNKDLSGDPNNYRIGFIRKYGIAKLEYLDSIAHDEKKYSIEELKEIINIYKNKLK